MFAMLKNNRRSFKRINVLNRKNRLFKPKGHISVMKRIPKRRTLSRPSERIFGIPPREKDIPKVFSKSHIGGKKPKGWERKLSVYRISFKAEYKITVSQKVFYQSGKRHYITISNARFIKRGYSESGVELESTALSRINKRAGIWKAKEIRELSARFPDVDSISYHRAGSQWRIYRVK